MNAEMVVLRLLHIVFGVFWAGSAIFFAAVLQPRLHKLGPEIRGPVLASLVPVMGPALIGSAVITIAAGVALTLRLRWNSLDSFLDTGWGWAILIGFIMAIGAISSGVSTIVSANRLVNLGKALGGQPPTPEQAAQMERLTNRIPRLARGTALMVLVAVGTMASARFV